MSEEFVFMSFVLTIFIPSVVWVCVAPLWDTGTVHVAQPHQYICVKEERKQVDDFVKDLNNQIRKVPRISPGHVIT